ncbi:hypothetical protein MTP99_006157 [Tenebrio molitor]|nr:hypothetical protein MTP99_006157 [Tenebrio molitor]
MSPNNENEFKGRLHYCRKKVKQVMEESVTRKFACLSQGLRRRALGLFKTSSTTALLHKIAKHSKEAALISKRVQEIENADPNRRSSSSSESMTKPTLKKNASLPANPLPKYLWIRLALFEKQLAKIIDYLVSNANKYYDKDALVADPDYGSILSSLLVGPCALDYSRTKTPDHFWTDPPADELVQRHRISSGHSTPPSQLDNQQDHHPTLRQRLRREPPPELEATLLFGKNNVLVLPVNADVTQPMPGYLSLHQTASGLTIKWTPNQLMNGFTDEVQDKSVYWDYALQVRLDEIVYVRCHQDSETGGTVILVGQDEVHAPPIHFPKGGHMLAFLSCIETGLLPRGRLDPPLWSQRSGLVPTSGDAPCRRFPKPRRQPKTTFFASPTTAHTKTCVLKRNELMDTHISLPPKSRVQLPSTSTSSESSTKSFGVVENAPTAPKHLHPSGLEFVETPNHLEDLLRLAGLLPPPVRGEDAPERPRQLQDSEPGGAPPTASPPTSGTSCAWTAWSPTTRRSTGSPTSAASPRTCARTGSSWARRPRQAYENTMSEWLAVEAIVKQKDKETQAAAIAKLSSESMSGEQVPAQIQRELSNEVFEDTLSDDDSDDDKPKKTRQNTIKYESDQEDGEARQVDEAHRRLKDFVHNVIMTNASVDMGNLGAEVEGVHRNNLDAVAEEARRWTNAWRRTARTVGDVRAESAPDRKDVQRCDRNYWYFTVENLDKLRNVMCTYVWEHLDVGYMQGMCDLVAPLLVVFNDESSPTRASAT